MFSKTINKNAILKKRKIQIVCIAPSFNKEYNKDKPTIPNETQ